MKLIGIDDAGRGPVIGPMILAGIIIEESEQKDLYEMGAKDSKLLTPSKRKLLGEKFKLKYNHHIEITSPKEIDNSPNLNDLEAIKTAKIINKLTEDIDEKITAIVDCPSVNTSAWGNFVKKLLKKPEKVILRVEHKADLNYPVVSAASIIAKEKREEEMFKLKKLLGEKIGSGYPSDPKTKEFIKNNFENPNIANLIRHSWKTIKNLKKDENQKKLF